jgi:hypothetical protein
MATRDRQGTAKKIVSHNRPGPAVRIPAMVTVFFLLGILGGEAAKESAAPVVSVIRLSKTQGLRREALGDLKFTLGQFGIRRDQIA